MKIIRIIVSIFIVCIIVLSFTVFIYKIGEKKDFELAKEYKGIITIWHIDTFEGGRGSRKQFLMDEAKQFEKQNSGVLIMAIEQTEESANELLKSGEIPDIISFGMGISLPKIVEIESDYSFKSGKINGIQYALPWCRGSYVYITNPQVKQGAKNIASLVISQKKYTNSCCAGVLESVPFSGFEIKEPLDAFIQFASGKTYAFWGTQRDIVRLENRNLSFEVKAMANYNDMYQYFCLTEKGKNKGYAEKFINYILSDKVQNDLSKICMFSPYINTYYEDEKMKEIQNTRYSVIPSAFTTIETIEKIQNLSKEIMLLKEEKFKLKNLII